MNHEWHLPGHWSQDKRKAHGRSMEFLSGIVAQSDGMEWLDRKHRFPPVLVRGVSRRWYAIELTAVYSEEYLEDYGVVEEILWRINVTGGAWKDDVVKRKPHSVSLCIGPKRSGKKLPIGDQVGALALSLRSDRTTAMRIPLLAQFIVSPRSALKEVYQFSEEGVIMEEDVFMMEDYEEFPEQVDDPWNAEEIDNIAQAWTAEMETVLEMANSLQEFDAAEREDFDRWIQDREEEMLKEPEEQPWHHDEAQVWKLEEDLLNGRN